MNVTNRLLAAAAAFALTAACSSGGTPPPAGSTHAETVATAAGSTGPETPTPGQQPMTQAGAQAAAKDGYDTYASGDYGGWWDIWTPDAQRVISRAEYLRLIKLCTPGGEGVPITIQKVTAAGGSAKVRWERAGLLVQTDTWTYVAGAWRYVPRPDSIADYKLGADKAAARRRSAGSCS